MIAKTMIQIMFNIYHEMMRMRMRMMVVKEEMMIVAVLVMMWIKVMRMVKMIMRMILVVVARHAYALFFMKKLLCRMTLLCLDGCCEFTLYQ